MNAVAGNTPNGTDPGKAQVLPPLTPAAVRAARDLTETRDGCVPMQVVVDLLTAYDNLAARYAFLVANVTSNG